MLLTISDEISVILLMLVIFILMYSPAIIMTIIGFSIRKKKSNAAKVLFILSGIYLIVGLGICASMV